MVLVIDNYDSFTYNLVQYFGVLGADVRVYRNDAITPEEAERLAPRYLVISPGPCTPDEAGVSLAMIRHFAGRVPILGVCLGHQAIAQAFGGRVVRARRLMHGKTSEIFHDGKTLYRGLPSPFVATRYHSLIVEEESLPAEFEVSARTAEGELMGLRHRTLPIEGVQFHPESILTDCGMTMLRNFLDTYAGRGGRVARDRVG
ncbi:aminodeoxychorismate/anthranilate synthase component II [Calditerricola yamamurae]